MSSAIWTRCAGSSRVRPLSASPWRSVEAQHLLSTRKLVDSAEEQEILEDLIDAGKPPLPQDDAFRGKHFLLTTPFRYPPLRHGSRFATRHERSLWYGSKTRRTAFAEVGYYRLWFLEGSAAELGRVSVELTAFRARARTRRGIDLTRPPFDAETGSISSPSRYDESRRLGAAMREAGVEVFRYRSARDPEGGANIALFTPRPFTSPAPDSLENWLCTADARGVDFQRKDFFHKRRVRFDREVFLVAGSLPTPPA